MTVPQLNLRPLSAGEILDKAFKLYRANVWLFVGIAAVLLVPFGALQILSQVYFRNTTAVFLLQTFLMFLLEGALTWAASHAYLGLPSPIKNAYLVGSRRFRSLWAASIFQALAYSPMIIVFTSGRALGIAGLLFALLIAIPYLTFLSSRWGVAVPAMIVENFGGSAGLGRSWDLTSKDLMHTVVTVLASGLLVYLVAALPGAALKYAVQQYGILPDVGPLLSIVITQLGSLLSTPLSVSAAVILYYDLRVRREGYDLQLAMQQPVPPLN